MRNTADRDSSPSSPTCTSLTRDRPTRARLSNAAINPRQLRLGGELSRAVAPRTPRRWQDAREKITAARNRLDPLGDTLKASSPAGWSRSTRYRMVPRGPGLTTTRYRLARGTRRGRRGRTAARPFGVRRKAEAYILESRGVEGRALAGDPFRALAIAEELRDELRASPAPNGSRSRQARRWQVVQGPRPSPRGDPASLIDAFLASPLSGAAPRQLGRPRRHESGMPVDLRDRAPECFAPAPALHRLQAKTGSAHGGGQGLLALSSTGSRRCDGETRPHERGRVTSCSG